VGVLEHAFHLGTLLPWNVFFGRVYTLWRVRPCVNILPHELDVAIGLLVLTPLFPAPIRRPALLLLRHYHLRLLVGGWLN
jgi:hypothetical protein